MSFAADLVGVMGNDSLVRKRKRKTRHWSTGCFEGKRDSEELAEEIANGKRGISDNKASRSNNAKGGMTWIIRSRRKISTSRKCLKMKT